MKFFILCITLSFVFLTACSDSSNTNSSISKNEMANENNSETIINTETINTETPLSNKEKALDELQIQGYKNIATPENEWRFEMCKTWKANSCVDPESADCKYWEKSENHMGVTMDLCVQAMMITLQQCSQKTAFFDKNPRDCKCVEEQYRITTHKPDLSKKEGPLYAEECFIDEAEDL